MKTLNYTILLEADEENGGFVVTIPALPGCVSYGRTYERALANAERAILAHLDGLVADGEPFPTAHPARSSARCTSWCPCRSDASSIADRRSFPAPAGPRTARFAGRPVLFHTQGKERDPSCPARS